MNADQRAAVWLLGAFVMLLGAFLVGWPVVIIAAGYLLTNWSRR